MSPRTEPLLTHLHGLQQRARLLHQDTRNASLRFEIRELALDIGEFGRSVAANPHAPWLDRADQSVRSLAERIERLERQAQSARPQQRQQPHSTPSCQRMKL